MLDFSNFKIYNKNVHKSTKERRSMKINKLKAKMIEYGYTQEDVAKELSMSNSTLNLRIMERVDFKLTELVKLKELLSLTDDEAIDIFFTNECA